MAASDFVQPFDSLQTSVTEILRGLKDAGPKFDSTVKVVQAALDALGTAGTIVRHHDDALTPAEAARYLAWLHELRSPVQVMAGWGRMLRRLDSEAKRSRARDVIERNAQLLVERLLAEPPG